MLGFLSARLPSGMIVHSMRLMVGPKGRRWIAMPNEKRRDQEDRLMLGADRKPLYDQFIEFADRQTRDRFEKEILGPLRARHPELSTIQRDAYAGG
jgi:hypothetical protein